MSSARVKRVITSFLRDHNWDVFGEQKEQLLKILENLNTDQLISLIVLLAEEVGKRTRVRIDVKIKPIKK